MKLERLKDLENIKVGDCFTIITPDFEDNIIQFVGRNPMIKDEDCSKRSGIFITVYGPKKSFILSESDLRDKKTEYYIGYDAEFILERRIERIIDHYNSTITDLQDRLSKLKECKTNKS